MLWLTCIVLAAFAATSAAQTAPEITADGSALTLSGESITFRAGKESTTVEALMSSSYRKETVNEMFQELRDDMEAQLEAMKTASAAKVASLESMLATTKTELDVAKQEREEFAGKLRLLRAHAVSDCRHDQFYNLEEQKCHECAEDPGRFYSELLDECMQCSEVADRILDGSGKCVLLEPCKAGEYVSQKPTDSSAQVCSKVSACKDHEYESAAPGRGSDRQCLPITPTCKRGVTYEIAPPTLLSDRVCRPVALECDFYSYYEAAAPTDDTDRICKEISPRCEQREVMPPTNTSDRVCEAVYETCKDVILQDPQAKSGMYTMRPKTLGGQKFKVYCKNDVAQGGWSLIAKIGPGNWKRLSNTEYYDLVLNKDNDVNPAELANEDVPIAGETMAFYNQKKTDALGASAIATSTNVAMLIWYEGRWWLQSRVAPGKDWSVFRAIRDISYWSSDVDTRDYSRDSRETRYQVHNFGTDFTLSGDLGGINFNTNMVRQQTCGDQSANFYTRFEANGMPVSKHGGLLGDGFCNMIDKWVYTLDEADGRFKNDRKGKETIIYMR